MTNPLLQPEFSDKDRSLSTAVIEAVSERAGEAPSGLPPLYETVDPDALDCLFEPVSTGIPRQGGVVEFPYAGYRVRISSDGGIDIEVSSRAP